MPIKSEQSSAGAPELRLLSTCLTLMMASSGGSAPNWLGLLKWSLAHTDGTTPTEAKTMTEEDKAFLERVMKEAIKDEPARMQEIMQEIITNLDNQTCAINDEHLMEILDELRDMTEQIDMAKVFVKFGGLQCLMGLIESPEVSLSVDVRSLAAGVIGTLAQNNLSVQEEIYQKGTVDRLATVCLASTSSSQLSAKALYAISCIVRNHAAAETDFILRHSESIFAKALMSRSAVNSDTGVIEMLPPEPVLARRAVFLGNALLSHTTDHGNSSSAPSTATVRTRLLSHLLNSLVPAVLPFVAHSDVDLREGTLHLLISIANTVVGHQRLQSPMQREALETALRDRQGLGGVLATGTAEEEVETVEQRQHEQGLLTELWSVLEGSSSPVSSTTPSNNIDSHPNNNSRFFGSAVTPSLLPTVPNEDNTTQPLLLLQPPPLNAASVPP